MRLKGQRQTLSDSLGKAYFGGLKVMQGECNGGGCREFVVREVREPFLSLVPQMSAAEMSMCFYKQLF